MHGGAGEQGPYRRSAREVEGPARRGSLGCITWAAALAMLGVGALVTHAVLRPHWTTESARALERDLSPLLREGRVAGFAHTYDPRALDMPEPTALLVGEQTEMPVRTASVREPECTLAPTDLGILITARGRAADHAQLHTATFGLRHRLAHLPEDVRWIGVTRSRMLRAAYSYGGVTVDVERVEVAVVDLASGELAGRLTVEAAPPASTSVPLDEYRVLGDRIGDAIGELLQH